MVDYPVRTVRVEGAVARAFQGAPPEYRTVREAADVDRERQAPADSNHCPLCNEYFGPEAFVAHAQDCINARAPRRRVWTPPGMLAQPIQAFAEKVKPTPGRF